MARSAPPIRPLGGQQIPLTPGGVIQMTEDHTAGLQAALDALSSIEVLIGIPSDRDQPRLVDQATRAKPEQRQDTTEEGAITSNATLGYIHEHGNPINNIPARPWLGPGVEGSKAAWLRYMQQAGEAALQGEPGRMDKALHAAGTTAVSAVKNRIVAGLQPPLSPVTIARRRARTPSRQARSQSDVTPLVDTAQMLNSISYVIKRG
jgi:hypothetical protein